MTQLRRQLRCRMREVCELLCEARRTLANIVVADRSGAGCIRFAAHCVAPAPVSARIAVVCGRCRRGRIGWRICRCIRRCCCRHIRRRIRGRSSRYRRWCRSVTHAAVQTDATLAVAVHNAHQPRCTRQADAAAVHVVLDTNASLVSGSMGFFTRHLFSEVPVGWPKKLRRPLVGML